MATICTAPAHGPVNRRRRPPETLAAKEAKGSWRPPGKTPRLFRPEARWGLRCALSGNPAPPAVTRRRRHKGKPPARRRAGDGGESLLDLKPQNLLIALPPTFC